MKKLIASLLTAGMIISSTPQTYTYAKKAKPKVKLNKTALTLKVKKKFILKLQNSKKQGTIKSSNKSVVKAAKKYKKKKLVVKNQFVLTGLKAGKATITVKANGKKYICKVTVKGKKKKKASSSKSGNKKTTAAETPATNTENNAQTATQQNTNSTAAAANTESNVPAAPVQPSNTSDTGNSTEQNNSSDEKTNSDNQQTSKDTPSTADDSKSSTENNTSGKQPEQDNKSESDDKGSKTTPNEPVQPTKSEKVLEVEKLIDAIPDEVTLKDQDTVVKARNAYDQLTAEERLIISDDVIKKAEGVIEQLEKDQQAIDAFNNYVNGLPEVNQLTLKDASNVKEAYDMYDKLTATQKNGVKKSYDLLISLEKKIDELKNQAIDQAKNLIDGLPEAENLSKEYEENINEADTAYQQLDTSGQQAVGDSRYTKLYNLKKRLTELKDSGLSETKATAGLDNNMPTQEDIMFYIKAHKFSKYYQDTYKTEYSGKGEKKQYDVSDIGSLTDESQNKALEYFNIMRYIAGVDPVTLNKDYESQTQAAAYVNYLRASLVHDIPQGNDLTDALYKLANEGGQSTNLASGGNYFYENMINRSLCCSIDDWMSDSDATNISAVGHRRWCMNPYMGSTCFGKATVKKGAESPYYYNSAMYAFDTSHTNAKQTGLSWPAANMPMGYFYNDDAWSYLTTELIRAGSNVKVTLTLKKSIIKHDKTQWVMDEKGSDDGIVYVNFKNIGNTAAIIFAPENMDIRTGDVYNVKIDGINLNVDYDVSFFDVNKTTSIGVKNSILNDQGNLILPVGGSYELSDQLTASPAGTYPAISYISSNEDVVSVNQSGKLTAKGSGKALITVIAAGAKSVSVPVKVLPKQVAVPQGKTLTYNGEPQIGVDLPENVEIDRQHWASDMAYEATRQGSYEINLKPKDGFTWEDGTTDGKWIEWSIE